MDVFVIFFGIFALTIAYLVWFWRLAQSLTGPKVLPLVGSLPYVFMNQRRFHDWVAENLRSTGAAVTYQTSTICIPFLAHKQGFYTVTCHPRNIEHILKTRFNNYRRGPMWHSAFYDLLGHGIFNTDGDTWVIQRKTAALEFTTRTLQQAMNRWVNGIIRTRLWIILDKVCKERRSVDLQDVLLRFTFDNICGLTFGKDPETLSLEMHENPFSEAFDSATEASVHRLMYPDFVWRLKKFLGIGSEKTLQKDLELIGNYIEEAFEARKEVPSDDLLSRFMKKKDADGKDYPNDVLKQIALNFVLAGRDTSAGALSWFFWLIINNPRVENKIMDELTTVLKQTRGENRQKWIEEPLVFDEADKLVYMKAAFAETLRLYPSVASNFRHAVSDDVLPDGSFVPAGSTVTYSIYSVGRMETIWGEDCLEFKPERWLSTGGDRFELPEDEYKFVVFNAGPRTCLGKDLSYLQMKSVASAVLLRYRLSMVPDHPIGKKISINMLMKYGLKVYLHPRELVPAA